MENRKRKRDPETGAPRIKYHVEQLGRSFERILKEDSHEELREVVRKKLNLSSATRLDLVQLRDGRLYDLEDDDDFEAFKAAAIAYSSLDVRVSFSPQEAASTIGHSAPGGSTELHKDAVSNQAAPSSGDEEDLPAPPKKKRKTDDGGMVVNKPKAKKNDLKGKDADRVPLEGEQKKQKKAGASVATVTEKKSTSKAKTSRVAGGQDQEPPKKKQKKSEVGTAKAISAVPIDAVSTDKTLTSRAKKGSKAKDTAAVDTDAAPPKKKQSKSKKPDADAAPGGEAASASVEGTSVPERSKATDTAVDDSTKRTKKKDVQTSGWDTSAPNASTQEPFLSASMTSALPDNSKKSRTLQEIFVAVRAMSSEEEPQKVAEEKTDEKIKPPTKPPVRKKSRLGEVLTPGDVDDASSVPRTEVSPSSPSGLAHPPLPNPATAHLPMVKPTVAAPTIPAGGVVATTPAVTTIPAAVPGPSAAAVTTAPSSATAACASSVTNSTPKGTHQSASKNKSASPCPICLARPFHLRFCCPTIMLGGAAIQQRLEELEAEGGKEDLVEELREWLLEKRKVKGRRVGRSPLGIEPEGTVGDMDATTPGSHAVHASVREWTSVRPRKGRVSEVTVESRDEGSDAEESSSSSSENVQDSGNKKNQSNVNSESESESTSGSSSDSASGRRRSLSMDLDDADLEEIMRGPAVKVQLTKLATEAETDSSEEGTELLEEEDAEEKRPRNSKSWKVTRSSSPEGVDQDDQESEAGLDLEKSAAVNQVKDLTDEDESNVTKSAQEATMITQGSSEGVGLGIIPPHQPEVRQKHGPDISPVIQRVEEAVMDTDVAVRERSKTPRTESPSELASTRPPTTPARRPASVESSSVPPVKPPTSPAKPPATPSRLSGPPSRAATRSPLVRQMKDRLENLPPNPPDDDEGPELPMAPAADDTPGMDLEEAEQPKRGRSRAPSQAKSTTRSTRSRSRTAGPSTTSTASTPSGVAPKRRGRPPLSEAVKAERQAIKDAEKAAREAAKKKPKAAVLVKANKKTNKPEKVHSESQAPPTATPNLGSQWKALAPSTESSFVSRSSPAIDQLASSSPAPPPTKDSAELAVVVVPGIEGIRSPGAASVTTSVSRMHDEDDVEQIVGSPKASVKERIAVPPQRPLFLPGASQMTQTQSIPHFFTRHMDQQTPASLDEQFGSASSSNTEAEEDEKTPQKPTIPRPSLPSKSAFPSLSQLSFDKFRPNFLLPTRGPSQKQKQDQQQPDEESDSDDEESSDDENDSHVPKGRLAGTGVVKKRKSRGLLDA